MRALSGAGWRALDSRGRLSLHGRGESLRLVFHPMNF
jgi:hypothetical protein